MDASRAHALLRAVEEARDAARAGDGAATQEPLERDYPEILEALDWFLAGGRADDASRLASALVPFWMATSRIDDGDRAFTRILTDGGPGPERRARALYDHGYLVFWAGRDDTAGPRFREALELATEIADADLAALALAGSARIALRHDPQAAVRLLREAVSRTETVPDGAGRSSALHVLGVALQMSGDLEGARSVMTERLERARRTGDAFVMYVESANLSMVERRLGDLDAAASLSRDALRIVAANRDELAVGWVINGLAAVTAAQGRDDRAASLLALAETLLERAGGEWPPDEREQHDETLAVLTDRLGAAAIDEARATAASLSFDAALELAMRD